MYIAGIGMSGDVRFTTDKNQVEDFVWQDMLGNQFMLLSMKTQRYL